MKRPFANYAAHTSSALLLAAACSGPEPAESETAIFPADFREKFTMVRDCRLSPAEHDGYFIEVYTRPATARAYTDGEYPFEPGTLLVKGEYEDENCSELARVTAMLRLEDGAAPELGNWKWQRTDAASEVESEASPERCAGCHRSCEASDFACTEP